MAVNRKTRKNPSAAKSVAIRPVLTTNYSYGKAAEQTLADSVYEQILLRIIRGEYIGGQELKSTLLAKDLGVSRTPVVQALQRLAADGIVNLELNKRALVRPGSENWLVEIHALRELLEPAAAALAAVRMPDVLLEQLRELAAAAAERPGFDHTSAEWAAAVQKFDFALHLAIADHTENRALGEAIRKCWSYKRLSYDAVVDLPETLAKAYEEHLAILQALAARDAQTASAAMLFHLRSAAATRPERRIV
jgi:DNA-binding GntR family transcriptional regulator